MSHVRVTAGPGPLIGGRAAVTGARVSAAGISGPPGPPGIGVATFSWGGTLQVVTGIFPWPVPTPCEAVRVSVAVRTAPTGANIVVDVLNNGVSLWSNPANRPRVLIGQTIGSSVPDLGDLMTDDILTFNIVQVGSVVPGAYLTGCVLLA